MVVAAPRHGKKAPARAGSKQGGASPSLWQRHRRDIWVLVLVVLGIFIGLAEVHGLGPVGRTLARLVGDLLGVGRVVLPVVLIGLGVAILWGKVEVDNARLGWGLALGLISVTGLGDLIGGRPSVHATSGELSRAGGWLGVAVGGSLVRALGEVGAVVVLLAILVVAVIVTTGIGLRTLAGASVRALRVIGRALGRWWTSRPRPESDAELDAEAEPTPIAPRRARRELRDVAPTPDEHESDSPIEPVEEPFDAFEEAEVPDANGGEWAPVEVPVVPAPNVAPVHETPWTLPPLALLTRTREQRQDRASVERAGAELVEALAAHGVETVLVGFTVGPTVTRFELELGPGVKVSRVTALSRDIAYAMATPDVRILAPIPGRSAIGVEVPNRNRTLVALGDLLSTDEARDARQPLDVPIGRDIAGQTVIVNLGEMPHVLISGATGAGKSSCINSLVTSLVMRANPDQVRLLLIDPKRVEMGHYQDLPHLLAPVVVDPKKAAGALAWAVKEMERRYDVLAACGARDLTSYQQMIDRGELEPGPSIAEEVADALERATGLASDVARPAGPERLPYIVIVVDELNDLMMVAARDVEDSVVRIAQMARAVGIHLVLATQRPSVDVITGVIKANVPSRMAFAVSSLADSRVILDQAGAERLVGKGDMLLVTATSNIARRIQSPWVSEPEVLRVVEYWRAQGGRSETVVALDVPVERSGPGGGSGDDDEVLRQARELVIRTQSGSTSMLQRKLRVGFARAGRLMDQLEQEGVVAAGDGSKARKVLITREEYFPDEDR